MYRVYSFVGLLLCVQLLGACGRFQRVRKSSSWKEKYKAAVSYYQAAKYNKASLLLEDILPLIRGATEGEEGIFMYAYTQYHQSQYILSAEYFKIFAKTYPRSEKIEEASYMHAYSHYLTSEPYYLDPSYTYRGLEALQAFIEAYPSSSRRPQTQQMVDDLQARLAQKAFQSAKQYHHLKYYRAAILSFEDFQRSFPDSKYIEESHFLHIDAFYQWAFRSVADKQHQRYRSLCVAYESFIDTYPRSIYVKKLELLYAQSLEEMQGITQTRPKSFTPN